MEPKQIGEYKFYNHCRSCKSKKIIKVINLGLVPLAGGFLRKSSELKKEKFYPLELVFCTSCFLLQTNAVVDADILFKDYFYHSSAIKTLVQHFEKIASNFEIMFKNPKNKFIVEIGCNDGSLIKVLRKRGFKALGIDPATNIVKPLIKKGLPIINNYFSRTLAKKIAEKYGKADIVFSSNTLAHIENISDIFDGVKILLSENGVLIFEVHYLGNLLSGMQFDMIYHEHQYYYSFLSAKNLLLQSGLEIYDAQLISMHAGSIRFYVQHVGGKIKLNTRAKKLEEIELKKRFHKISTYKTYNKKIVKAKNDLLQLVKILQSKNKTIAGYGASGRGTILSNFCGLDTSILRYVIDDAPAKQFTLMPGTHVPITSSNILYTKQKVDYVILFAWSFYNEIRKKHMKFVSNGGKFVIPLPFVKVI